jgi:enediyne biosynthesis protein E4
MAAGLGVQNRYVEWGSGMPDLDNDGRPDIFYVTGNVYPEIERVMPEYPHKGPRVTYRNVDGTRFEDVTQSTGAGQAARSSRGAAFGDVDNDGDIDVLVMNMNEPPSLLTNGYSGRNRWLLVKLEGSASNRSAIGATVVLRAGGRTQARAVLSQSSYYSHDDLRLHFGLGPADRVDEIQIRWPGGATQVLKDVAAGQILMVKESKPLEPKQ